MKTPGRGIIKPRNALQENTFRDVPTTINAKGKKVIQGTPLQLKAIQTDRVVKDALGKQAQASKVKGTPVVRPLGDKTPFPNRTANRATLVSSPSARLANRPPPDESQANSARRHVRLPRSASKSFETPVNAGNHWDTSEIDIIEVGGATVNHSYEEEDYDEVEYMPPKVDEVPYEPPFELPNYREVGKTLMALIRSYPVDDDPPPDPSFTSQELETPDDKLALPIIEDDMFTQVNTGTKQPVTSDVQNALPTSRRVPHTGGSRTRTSPKEVAHTSAAAMPSAPHKISSVSAQPLASARRVQTAPQIKRPQSARAPAPATRTPSLSRSAQSTKTGPAISSPLGAVRRPATSTTMRPPSIASKNEPIPNRTTRNPSIAVARSRSTTVSKPLSNVNLKVAPRSALLETPKDLEGLIIFEDNWETEEFRFDI